MQFENNRLAPPIWRHDAYTLKRLRTSIEAALDRVAAAIRRLEPDRAILAYDIGSGNAPYRSLFVKRSIHYKTCDILFDENEQSAPDVQIRSGDPICLDSSSADLIVSFQVLEHIWDLDWYLGEVKRLLKPDGHLVLSTHGSWLYHPHPTDYRRWTRDGLIKELEIRGFNVEMVCADVGPLAWTTQFRVLAYHHVLSRIWIFGSMLSALFCTFMYFRMFVEDFITPEKLKLNNAAVYTVVAVHTNLLSPAK